MTEPFDVITMGRIGVDLYPLQSGVALQDVESFGKFLGGSAANVAVAAARHGRRTAVVTRTGGDPFGTFLHAALRRFGVDDRYVMPVARLNTPITFCEIFPPDDFPLYFYREPKAPDLEIRADELDLDAIRSARVFWVTVTGLSQEPSRSATLAALRARGKSGITVLDLDYRPIFWPSPEEARSWVAEALPHVTVAVGNREECEVAVGEREPRAAARALLARGLDLAVVKQGPDGVLAATGERAVEVPPVPVEVVNGLGAGDAFGGALCHGLLAGWDVERIMRFGNAAGAIVAAQLSCADAMPDEHEVLSMLKEAVNVQAPGARIAELAETRRRRPQAIAEAAAARRRPGPVADLGPIMVIAADHTARGMLGVKGRPLAMADRGDLLDRLCLALSRPGVNGVLGTPDIIEDLLLLGALDGKAVFGSMNRGGLGGASWELDDRFTAYDAATITAMGFEGGKMLTRIDLENPATAATVEACSRAVSELAARELIAMVEPFMTTTVDGRVKTQLTTEAAIKASAISAGLGTTSAYTWLKVPVVEDMEAVAGATTLPTVLLGGEVREDQDAFFETWRTALAIRNVVGMVVGRSLLYPADDDVARAVDTVVGLFPSEPAT